MAADTPRPSDAGPKWLDDAHASPTEAELRREQRREAVHTTHANTEAQVHGALIGAVAFGLVGLLLGFVVGLALFDAGSPARYVVPVVAAVFAAWAGLVYGGGRAPEVEHETRNIYGEPEDGTSERPPENTD